MDYLEPLESLNEIRVYEGRFRVQLERPIQSTLVDEDLDRIGFIAAWKDGKIDDKITELEGSRAITIPKATKSRRIIPLRGLQISGVCYIKPKQIRNSPAEFVTTGEIVPPTPENFYETEMGRHLGTSAIKDGKDKKVRLEKYTPTGSYTTTAMLAKVQKTQEANSWENCPFAVPNAEAYGRYVDLEGNGESMAFTVFSIPDASLPRLPDYFYGKKLQLRGFVDTMEWIAHLEGQAARYLHEQVRKVHRQLHPANIYYVKSRPLDVLHINDWDTLLDIDSVPETDLAPWMSIDIRIPHQNYEKLLQTFYRLSGDDLTQLSVAYLRSLFIGYFDRDINMDRHVLTSEYIHDDKLFVADVIRKEKGLP